MIKILDEFERGFVEFLNNKNLTDKVVKLSILHNYETVGDGEFGFAVYIPESKTIMLPTERPKELADYKEFIIHNLAHEYKHFLQDMNGQDFNEDEADQFADMIVEEYLKEVSDERIKFKLNGCDISFVATAPADITLKQLLKQCDKIKPLYCACGIRSLKDGDYDKEEIIIDYDSIKKAHEDVSCWIIEEEKQNE